MKHNLIHFMAGLALQLYLNCPDAKGGGYLEFFKTVNDSVAGGYVAGQEEGWHLHELDDTSYVLTGFSTNPSCGSTGKHALLMKLYYHAQTNTLSTTIKYFGDSSATSNYQGRELHPITSTGDFIFVGLTDKNENDQILLMKLDENLDTIWTRIYGDSLSQTGAYAVQPTGDDGFVIVGYTRPYGFHDSTDVYILRVDNNGDALPGWPKIFDIASDIDVGKSVRVYREGGDSGFVVAGFTRVNDEFDMLLIKTDFSGNCISGWPKTYDGGAGQGDFGETIILVKDTSGGEDGYFVSGVSNTSPVLSSQARSHVWRIDTAGDTLWTSTLADFGTSLTVTSGAVSSVQKSNHQGFNVGSIHEIGASYSGFIDILITDISANGQINWQRRIGGPAADYVYWMQPTEDSGFVFCGATFSPIFGADSSDIVVGKARLAQCGDVNLDGNISIADLIALTKIVDSSYVPPDYATANADGSCPAKVVTSLDVTYLRNYMFFGGPAPECPWCH